MTMDNLEGSCGPRRVILDVSDRVGDQGYTSGTPTKRSRRRRRQKQTGDQQKPMNAISSADADEDDNTKLPIELWPAIQEILGYGKKTHALGAMKAASALSDFVMRLRALELASPEVEKILTEAEKESSEIRTLFCRSYEE